MGLRYALVGDASSGGYIGLNGGLEYGYSLYKAIPKSKWRLYITEHPEQHVILRKL